ncbi:MAG: hypothetical protein F4X77_16210 [Acidobacteriia bacterium]|nr:hypothetical protein [Terriglobia bacterium]
MAKLFTVTESSGISWFDLAAPVAITILASAGLVYGPTGKASLHFDLYRRFINLEKEFLSRDLSDQELDRLEGLRLEIELDEPATYQALDRLCHNELLKSEGRYELMLDLGLWHRLWMGFWRFDDLPKSQGQNS